MCKGAVYNNRFRSFIRTRIANRIPEIFPRLRWGFIESGASWVPFVLHDLKSLGHQPVDWSPKFFERSGVIADPSAQPHMVKTVRSWEEYPGRLVEKTDRKIYPRRVWVRCRFRSRMTAFGNPFHGAQRMAP